jgi:tetratricopeptide (TPR) repeat protein
MMAPDLSTFWTLERPKENSALFCWAPYVAYERLMGRSPCSLGLQRKHTSKFRKELALTQQHPRAEFLLKEKLTNDLAANLSGQSDSSEKFLEYARAFPELSANDKCNLVYGLLSLGFFDEAVRHLKSTTLETPRLEVLNWLAKDLQNYGKSGSVGDEGLHLLHKIPAIPVNIRCRFNLLLQLVVYFSQRKDLSKLGILQKCASEIFLKIDDCGEPDFVLNIMKSKYFRSLSYIPFLEGDRQELLRQTKLIESYAHAAKPNNEIEEIIFRENIFPMKESTARIYDFLGQSEEALSRLSEIAHTIDPYDSKAWMQLGDYQLRKGKTEEAHLSYLRASECIMPHANIIAYKLAGSFERRGEIAKAIEWYGISYGTEPNGFSPLLKIHELSKGALKACAMTKSITECQAALLRTYEIHH